MVCIQAGRALKFEKMKMKTQLIFGIAVFAILLLVGCSGSNGSQGFSLFNPYKGSSGLQITFIKNAPMTEEYDNRNFAIAVKLENMGAAKIENGMIVLGADNPYTIDFDKKSASISLDGKIDTGTNRGEPTILFFRGKIPELSGYQNLHLSTASIKACYPYYTLAQSAICIDTDFYGLSGNQKVCTAKDLSFKDQGAPVAITKIENSIIPEDDNQVRIALKIYYKNLGDGKVVAPASYQKFCSMDTIPDEKDFGIMNIDVEASGKKLECQGQAEMYANNEGSITCFSDLIPTITSYKTSLTVRLDYGYVQVAKTSFSIISPN